MGNQTTFPPLSDAQYRETNMASDSDSNGALGLVGVLIGALIVVALGYVFLGERLGLRSPTDVDVKIEAPDVQPSK